GERRHQRLGYEDIPPPRHHPDPQTPIPSTVSLSEVATDLQQKGASQKRPSGQECGPTPNKGADQPAQRNQNTPHKGGPMTSTPSHPRTQGAPPTERPVPDAGQHIPLQHRGRHQAAPDPKQQSHPKASSRPG
ncbi:hypothetical protein CRENBAI_006228, partial [Crenichthys baileyi]